MNFRCRNDVHFAEAATHLVQLNMKVWEQFSLVSIATLHKIKLVHRCILSSLAFWAEISCLFAKQHNETVNQASCDCLHPTQTATKWKRKHYDRFSKFVYWLFIHQPKSSTLISKCLQMLQIIEGINCFELFYLCVFDYSWLIMYTFVVNCFWESRVSFSCLSLPLNKKWKNKFNREYFSRNSDYFKWIHRMKKRVINSCHPSFERFFRNSFQTRGKKLLHCCWIVRRKKKCLNLTNLSGIFFYF